MLLGRAEEHQSHKLRQGAGICWGLWLSDALEPWRPFAERFCLLFVFYTRSQVSSATDWYHLKCSRLAWSLWEAVPPTPANSREKAVTPAWERSGFILVCVTSVNADAIAGPFHTPWCTWNTLKRLSSYWQLLWIIEWRELFNCTQTVDQESWNQEPNEELKIY